MTPSGLTTGLVAVPERRQRRKVATGAWPELVNGAGNPFANVPAQRDAT
jgi:hypothetical protein